jgi:hypothetical protein
MWQKKRYNSFGLYDTKGSHTIPPGVIKIYVPTQHYGKGVDISGVSRAYPLNVSESYIQSNPRYGQSESVEDRLRREARAKLVYKNSAK